MPLTPVKAIIYSNKAITKQNQEQIPPANHQSAKNLNQKSPPSVPAAAALPGTSSSKHAWRTKVGLCIGLSLTISQGHLNTVCVNRNLTGHPDLRHSLESCGTVGDNSFGLRCCWPAPRGSRQLWKGSWLSASFPRWCKQTSHHPEKFQGPQSHPKTMGSWGWVGNPSPCSNWSKQLWDLMVPFFCTLFPLSPSSSSQAPSHFLSFNCLLDLFLVTATFWLAEHRGSFPQGGENVKFAST